MTDKEAEMSTETRDKLLANLMDEGYEDFAFHDFGMESEIDGRPRA